MKKFIKRLWKDESAQGMTEYILMLVVVLTIAMIFKKKLGDAIGGKMGSISDDINGFQ